MITPKLSYKLIGVNDNFGVFGIFWRLTEISVTAWIMALLKDTLSNQKLLRYGVLSAFALCIFFSIFYWVIRELERSIVFNAESFNSGWTLTIDDRRFDNVDLSDFSFPVVSTGTKVVLENKLPEITVENPVLRMYTSYCTVDARINDKIVYRYGQEYVPISRNVGSGMHIISLYGCTPGTDIKIILNVTEPRSFTSFQPVWIEDARKSFSNMLSGRLFMMFCSVFLVLTGLVGTIVVLIFIAFEKGVAKILPLSMFLLCLGLYELYANKCVNAFYHNYSINTWVEYFMLYCTNFSVLAVFYKFIARTKIIQRIVLGLIYGFAIFCSIALLLDFSGIMHLPSFRSIQFVFLGAEILLCIFVSIRNVLVLVWRERLPTIGFLFMLLFMIVDIVRYPIQKYFSLNLQVMQGSPLSFGVLVFVTIMIAHFLFQIRPDSEKMAVELIKDEQLRLDYQTGLLNAFAINEYLKNIETANDVDFSAIMLTFTSAGRDTPDLFSIEGSEVLSAFIGCIKKIFCEKAKIAYLGDEEFCIIAPNLRKEDIHRMMVNLDELLFTEIQKHPRYQYSMSSGSALRSEVEYVSNLLPLAKERMLSQKEGFRS